MIRKLIGKMLGRKTGGQLGQLRRYSGAELGLQKADISSAGQRTCDILQKAGFKAYVVGGCVRDALADLRPKDFDVATDATPEEVVKLFRRARIIGRRFKIVHVMFGRETIEVSTFRALQSDAQTDDHGRVLRDNEWGTQSEDAARRDFTVNALYYDPIGDEVLDYHDGVKDIRNKKLRMIGDPASRYREDPVRMLRVARFAAKLNFKIEPATRAPMAQLSGLINNVPNARLFDEILKLLTCGNALACLEHLRSAGLHKGLLPLLDLILEQPEGEHFIRTALERTDKRITEGKSISPGFLFATLLWHEVNGRWQANMNGGAYTVPALMQAIDEVLELQARELAIQKRFTADMREIWSLQPRFERRNGQAPYRLLEHMRFRAGYDFLLLRCDTGQVSPELGQWWTDFIDANADDRKNLVEKAPDSGRKRRRNRRRRRGPRSESQASKASDNAQQPRSS